MTPDPLDALFRRLVANLTALDPGAIHRPVRVGEISERLVPYRTHRKALGFDTNEDYEMAVLRLLSGERDLAQVFPAEVAAALAREAASANPDTTIFRRFPEATVLLNADQVTGTEAERQGASDELATPGDAEPESLAPEAVMMEEAELEADAADDDDADSDSMKFALEESDDARVTAQPREITASAPCPYCGGGLPVGRTVLFCPHCGQNIGVVHCPTCGSELDVGWGFCITCGQKVTGLG